MDVKRPKTNTILSLLGFLLIFGLGIYFLGVYNATPKEIDLQKWMTYSNVIVGYTVQFPIYYKAQENFSSYDPANGPLYESVTFMPNEDSIDKIITSGSYFISISHTLLEKEMTVLDYWNQQVKAGLIRGQSVTKTTVSGKDAVEVSGTRIDSQDKTIYFIDNKWLTAIQLNFYTPTYAEGKKRFPDAEPSFYQIVKTFTLVPGTQGILFNSAPVQDPPKMENVKVEEPFLIK